jgi:hypothetical protein
MYETVIVRDSKTGPVTTVRRSRDAPDLAILDAVALHLTADGAWGELVPLSRLLRCTTTVVARDGGC